MASGMTPAKRFAVRTSLVAGSTLAVVLGAQSLILLDTASTNLVTSSAASMINTADSTSSTVADSTVSTIRQASSASATTNAVAVVPTASTLQQITIPSIPTTRSSH